jgi:hypothetical protein
MAGPDKNGGAVYRVPKKSQSLVSRNRKPPENLSKALKYSLEDMYASLRQVQDESTFDLIQISEKLTVGGPKRFSPLQLDKIRKKSIEYNWSVAKVAMQPYALLTAINEGIKTDRKAKQARLAEENNVERIFNLYKNKPASLTEGERTWVEEHLRRCSNNSTQEEFINLAKAFAYQRYLVAQGR